MKKVLFTLAFAVLVVGCKKTKESVEAEGTGDNEYFGAESAAAVIGSASSAAEGSIGTFAASPTTTLADIGIYSACSFDTARSNCNAGERTVTWNNCTLGRSHLSGGWLETYSDSNCQISSIGATVTRTTTSSINSTLTLASGATLTSDTLGGTAYDSTGLGSTGVVLTMASGNRTISIDSLHHVLKGPKGRKWFDYYIKTAAPITVSGSRLAGTRTVSAGSVTIYHNLAKYTAEHTFSNVQWADPTCCYPTSGTINSNFTGSISGSSTLTFSSTCGEAAYQSINGNSSSVTLTQCH